MAQVTTDLTSNFRFGDDKYFDAYDLDHDGVINADVTLWFRFRTSIK